MGIFWPCPSRKHPGTPRLFEGGEFHHPDGKARFHGFEYRPPAEDVDAEYPIFFTTGRVVSQYLSGNQTRRIGPLVDQYPEPLVRNASVARARLGIKTANVVKVITRRGEITRARAGRENHSSGYGVRSVPLARKEVGQPADEPRAGSDFENSGIQGLRLPRGKGRQESMNGYEFFIDPSRCIGCQACVQACMECDTHRGRSMIHLEFVDRAITHADEPGRLHALRGPDLRARVPGRRDQADRRRHRSQLHQAALHRLLELRAGLPVRRAAIRRGDRPDDEVRHVLRSHEHRQETDVRHRLPEPGALLRASGRMERLRLEKPVNEFQFGEQTVRTKVKMMTAPDSDHIDFDILAYMPESMRSNSRRCRVIGVGGLNMSKWKTDFPVACEEDNYATRREFTKFLGFTSLAFAIGTFAAAMRKWLHLVLADRPTAVSVDPCQRDTGRGLQAVPLSNRERSLHPAAPGGEQVCRVRSALHASLLPGVFQCGQQAVGLPVPSRVLRCGRRTANRRTSQTPAHSFLSFRRACPRLGPALATGGCMSPKARLRRRMTIVLHMVTGFVIAILLAQLWLFTVTLDSMQNEEASIEVAAAAFICSAAGFAVVWALIRFFLRAEETN